MHVPVGTTAQRPTGADGYFRYNSEDAQFEGYADGAWGAIAGGGGGSAMETDTFTGDGSTTAFTLTSTVANENNLIVFIEGVYQNKADYIVNTRKIVVHHVKSSISGSNSLLTSLSGDGSTTAFTLVAAPGDENNTQVFMDGVYQQKDSYTVSGTTLTFDAAPANGAEIEVMSFTQTTLNAPAANTVGVAELNLSDGTSGQAIVTDGNGTISFSTISGYTDSDVETYLDGGTSTPVLSNATFGGMILKDGTGGAIGFNRNPYNGAYVGSSSLQRFQINGPDAIYGDFLDFQSYNSSGTYTGSVYLNAGNVTISDGDLTMSGTGAVKVPSGTTAQRPSSPVNGMVRYNTDNSNMEGYIDGDWQSFNTGAPSLTTISGLDLWADVTNGITSTTVADLSGNNRTGTLLNTSAKGTTGTNTYLDATTNYIDYANTKIPDYAQDVTYFFVMTNVRSLSGHKTFIGQTSGSTGYQIIRTSGNNVNLNIYWQNVQNSNHTITNAGVTSNSTLGSSTQIITFSFGAPANGNFTVYKRAGGINSSDVFANSTFGSNVVHSWTSNGYSTRIGNSNWGPGGAPYGGEELDAGIYAWGIIDHEITSVELNKIYNYYAERGLGT
jgi:hypothetical protein